MRFVILSLSALALAACGGEAPAAPVDAPETPAADAHEGHGPMDDAMKASDASDDANTAETPDGFMFHTDTSKTESIHLPTAAGVIWTATPEKAGEVEIVSVTDQTMPDGAMHHVITLKPVKRDVIAKVKVEKREGGDPASAVTETRTINVMIH